MMLYYDYAKHPTIVQVIINLVIHNIYIYIYIFLLKNI